jgi:hypothetical protein
MAPPSNYTAAPYLRHQNPFQRQRIILPQNLRIYVYSNLATGPNQISVRPPRLHLPSQATLHRFDDRADCLKLQRIFKARYY